MSTASLFNETRLWQCYDGTDNNQNSKAVSDTANDLTLVTIGVWKISADIDMYVRGPTAATAAATTNSQFLRAGQNLFVETKLANQHVSMLRVGGVNGTAHCGLVHKTE